jgi:hypothetical protein
MVVVASENAGVARDETLIEISFYISYCPLIVDGSADGGLDDTFRQVGATIYNGARLFTIVGEDPGGDGRNVWGRRSRKTLKGYSSIVVDRGFSKAAIRWVAANPSKCEVRHLALFLSCI